MINRIKFFKLFIRTKQKIKCFFDRFNIIVVFFVLLFAITLTSFFSFSNPMSSLSVNRELPSMEIARFVLIRFNEKYVDTIIIGDSIQQFKDREIYTNFDADKIDDTGTIEHLGGKEVLHLADSSDEYNFTKGVFYSKSPHIKFFSQSGVYNVSDETFRGAGDFSIDDEGFRTIGENIFYDKKTDTITADNITAQILKQ